MCSNELGNRIGVKDLYCRIELLWRSVSEVYIRWRCEGGLVLYVEMVWGGTRMCDWYVEGGEGNDVLETFD